MSVSFNINDHVRIKVNQRGLEAWDKFYAELGIERPLPKSDWDGRITMQMHEVMLIFGPAMFMGPPPAIDPVIEFA